MNVNYNWLKEYVGDAIPPAEEVAELLTKHAFEIEGVEEVAGQTVIDVDVLPNRASDCLCHRGIARELASILNVPLAHDPLAAAPALTLLSDDQQISVDIAEPDACSRFSASLITGVTVGESPDWLKIRLESLGQRSINNIVDATNYVMYAIGQPLHAYDADLFPQVDGAWRIAVRYARPGEIVEILPEGGSDEPRQVECLGTELLIVDQSSDTPIGLAGVKGGQFAGVRAGTTRIIIEAANFDPIVTRKTARRLGIVIDASKRFENDLPNELAPYAQRDIISLITDIAGGTYIGTVDQLVIERLNPAVDVRVSRANKLLGLTLSQQQVADIIERTGSEVFDETEANIVTCIGPWERTDLNIEEDFIEEVGRLYGLDQIQLVAPTTDTHAAVNKHQYYAEGVRQALLAAGASEVITSSFQKKDQIQLRNALASDKSYVRSTLRKNMSRVLDQNFVHGDLLGVPRIAAFEIGTVFDKGEGAVGEHTSLCIGVRGKGSGHTPKDDKELTRLTTVVADALGVTPEWQIEQGVAEVDFGALIATLPTPNQYNAFIKNDVKTFRPISQFPAVSRDIALWVPADITSTQVEALLRASVTDLCVRIDLFDEFTKEGRTSYAFRLVFLSHQKTLTDGEVHTIMDRVYAAISEQGWEVR
jgi:phenylalanyl-tRNA synthetase beta chain